MTSIDATERLCQAQLATGKWRVSNVSFEPTPAKNREPRNWRKITLVIAGLMLLGVVIDFFDGDEKKAQPKSAATPVALPPPSDDLALRPTSSEFDRRLVRNYGGSLGSLNLTDSVLNAEWSSAKCDFFDPEVIDLLLSINRTLADTPDVRGRRTCDGRSRDSTIAAHAIREYRSGRLNDTQVLAAVK